MSEQQAALRLSCILWLEDQPDTKPTVIEGLEWTFDCIVTVARNLEEFLPALRNQRADVILLDLRLPEAGTSPDEVDPDYGFNALDEFYKAREDDWLTQSDVPVVVVSARFDVEAKRLAEQYRGVRAFVEKPFTYEQLIGAIAEIFVL
jgi:CheY-like chemotaxis protein